MPVANIGRPAEIRQATYFNLKKKYEGLPPLEMRRLKQLEGENAQLRKLHVSPFACHCTPGYDAGGIPLNPPDIRLF